jgi:hypothetical protein
MIDPVRLGGEGRTVRCASCRETFFVAPEPEQPADEMLDADWTSADDGGGGWSGSNREAADPGGPEAEGSLHFPRKAASRAEAWDPEGGTASGLGGFPAWTAGVAASVFLIAAAVWGRAEVVRALPATARLYASIGFPVNLRGLEFREVRSELVTSGAETFLVVEGEITNVSGHDSPVPPVEIGVRGPDGQVLYTWSNDPPQATLGGSESAPFRARLAAPPGEAREVLVRFAVGADKAAVASRGP